MFPSSAPLVPGKPGKRSLQLDFLRGIAIIVVLFHHLRIDVPSMIIVGDFFAFLHRVGWVGVDLFFVLSGFLVGGLLINELEKHGSLNPQRFLIRRGLKIYPLYYVFFAYLFAMPLLKAAIKGGDLGATFGELWTLYWPNLFFLNGYLGSNPVGHTWTLAIEEHFYLILPFFLLLLNRRFSMKQITLVCAAIFVPVVAYRAYVVLTPDMLVGKPKQTHFRIDALFLGVAVRGWLASWPAAFARLRDFRHLMVAVGVVLIVLPEYVSVPFLMSWGYALTMFGAAGILIGTYHMRAADLGSMRAPGMKLVGMVCWVGTFSYSIYLWHVTVFRILERFVETRGLSDLASRSMWVWVLCAFTIFAVSVVVSAMISRIVEIPVLKFRDRFFPSRSSSIPDQRHLPAAAELISQSGEAGSTT